jgi:hypothetical protein
METINGVDMGVIVNVAGNTSGGAAFEPIRRPDRDPVHGTAAVGTATPRNSLRNNANLADRVALARAA